MEKAHPGLVYDRDEESDLRVVEGLVDIRERGGHQALHLDVAHAHHVQGLIAVEHQGLDLAVFDIESRKSCLQCWVVVIAHASKDCCSFVGRRRTVSRPRRLLSGVDGALRESAAS